MSALTFGDCRPSPQFDLSGCSGVGSGRSRAPQTRRGTGADVRRIREAIYYTLAADHPATVRQVFYRLVSGGVIEKTEAEYKQTVCRLLTEMRLSGYLSFDSIADNTRWMQKPDTTQWRRCCS
jgi:hypothetical protein